MTENIISAGVSLLFTLILLLYNTSYFTIPTSKNKAFLLSLYSIAISILVTILFVGYRTNTLVFSLLSIKLITFFYYLSVVVMVGSFELYILLIIMEGQTTIKKITLKIIRPLVVFILLLIVNVNTGIVYSISESGEYIRGIGYYSLIVVIYYYILLVLLEVYKYKQIITKAIRLTSLFSSIFTAFFITLQFVYSETILTGIASAVNGLILYLYIHSRNVEKDDLTDLQNRSALYKMLDIVMEQKQKVEIVIISLDDFKIINDKYGQVRGDKVLKEISKYLKSIMRTKNIYRFSGDEFVLLIDDEVEENGLKLIEKIRERLHRYFIVGKEKLNLKASIGLVSYPIHVNDVADIIHLLEYCVTISKENGKGQVIIADKTKIDKIKREIQIVEVLKKALQEDRFTLNYQPIYDINSNSFTVFEALLRLHDDKLGNISPSEFIPVAEKTSMIIDIGYVVLDKVCKYVKKLEASNVNFEYITVNFSSLQIYQNDLVEKVTECIYRNGVKPEKICIEITENVLIDKYDDVKTKMLRLKKLGVNFYLDDFGTGYSNMTSVIKLPFTCIKIDKSLLYTAEEDYTNYSLVSAFVTAFTSIGVTVLIEGVETIEQDEIAKELGVHKIQGFYYSKPLHSECVEDFLGLKEYKIEECAVTE